MRFEVNIEKKYFFGLIALGLMIIGIVGVVANGTSTPSVFGHSVGEIDWSQTISGQVKSSGGFCIGSNCINSWGSTGGSGNCSAELCARDSYGLPSAYSWSAWSCASDGSSMSVTSVPANQIRQYIFKCKDDSWLYNSDHTVQGCTTAGGVAMNNSLGDKFCQFSNSYATSPPTNYCPSQWKPYKNWSETSAKTCVGTDRDGCTGSINCSVTGHAWGNTAPENCNYRNSGYQTVWVEGQGNVNYCAVSSAICFNVTKIACY